MTCLTIPRGSLQSLRYHFMLELQLKYRCCSLLWHGLPFRPEPRLQTLLPHTVFPHQPHLFLLCSPFYGPFIKIFPLKHISIYMYVILLYTIKYHEYMVWFVLVFCTELSQRCVTASFVIIFSFTLLFTRLDCSPRYVHLAVCAQWHCLHRYPHLGFPRGYNPVDPRRWYRCPLPLLQRTVDGYCFAFI